MSSIFSRKNCTEAPFSSQNFQRLLDTPYGIYTVDSFVEWVASSEEIRDLYSTYDCRVHRFIRPNDADLRKVLFEDVFNNLTSEEKFIVSFNMDEIDNLKARHPSMCGRLRPRKIR